MNHCCLQSLESYKFQKYANVFLKTSSAGLHSSGFIWLFESALRGSSSDLWPSLWKDFLFWNNCELYIINKSMVLLVNHTVRKKSAFLLMLRNIGLCWQKTNALKDVTCSDFETLIKTFWSSCFQLLCLFSCLTVLQYIISSTKYIQSKWQQTT